MAHKPKTTTPQFNAGAPAGPAVTANANAPAAPGKSVRNVFRNRAVSPSGTHRTTRTAAAPKLHRLTKQPSKN